MIFHSRSMTISGVSLVSSLQQLDFAGVHSLWDVLSIRGPHPWFLRGCRGVVHYILFIHSREWNFQAITWHPMLLELGIQCHVAIIIAWQWAGHLPSETVKEFTKNSNDIVLANHNLFAKICTFRCTMLKTPSIH